MIIGLTGKKRTGKSEASKMFQDSGFKLISFKKALLDEIKKYLPDLLEFWANKYDMTVNEVLEKKPCEEIRLLLQNWGTDFRRKENKNYWTLKWLEKVNKYMDDTGKTNIVVDDCRFLNEAKVINDFSGKIIRMIRPGFNGDGHLSETEQDNIQPDYTIEADNLDSLYEQIEKTYEDITRDKQRRNDRSSALRSLEQGERLHETS